MIITVCDVVTLETCPARCLEQGGASHRGGHHCPVICSSSDSTDRLTVIPRSPPVGLFEVVELTSPL